MIAQFCFFLLFVDHIFCKDFLCDSGEVISFDEVCDGEIDCPDKTDEENCDHLTCSVDEFRCHYGACIDKSSQCDGTIDCLDESDEINCFKNDCNESQFQCSSGECISIEKLCDQNTDCEDGSDEKTFCKQATVCPPFTHRCKIGNCISMNQLCDGHIDCIDASDETESVCSFLECNATNSCNSKIFCSPISSERINVHCEVLFGPKIGIVPCELPLPVGTKVSYECRPNYVPVNPKDEENREMHCQVDGNWSRQQLKCKPECGLADYDVSALIVNGWLTQPRKFPWHAVLYALEDGDWIFTCGGTLINEKVILTAAHCTWNIPKEMLQVALGKLYSDYSKPEINAQFRNLSHIFIQPAYQDFEGNFGSDIAILVLDEPIEFSFFIRPACVDWSLHDLANNLKHNEIGLIAGMGVTENDTFSHHLKAIHLPTVDIEQCVKNQKRDFKKYVTFTTFCAGWANGSGVCNGDSGGGLVFRSPQNKNKFTIQGIVSVSPRRPGTSFCDPNYYTVFTKVGMYVHWIWDVLESIHDEIDHHKNVVF